MARARWPADAPHRFGVIRIDGAVEAVFAVVCDADGIGVAFVREDGDHRPENLLARDRHAIVDPVEQRRLHEIAAIEMRGAAATGDEPGALGLTDGDAMLDPFALPRQGARPQDRKSTRLTSRP